MGKGNDLFYATYAVSIGFVACVDEQGRAAAAERNVGHKRTAIGEGLVGYNQVSTTAQIFKLVGGSIEDTARTDGRTQLVGTAVVNPAVG